MESQDKTITKSLSHTFRQLAVLRNDTLDDTYFSLKIDSIRNERTAPVILVF